MAQSVLFARKFSGPTVKPKSKFRADIQGLRAIAVVAVILDHLLHWPSGGFVGVDVFFVLSGFLITGLLLREHEKTGRISFANFYRRRARRILPLAALVLAVTVAASFLLYSSARAVVIAQDSIWAFFFSANWHFALIGTDYMNAGSAISPVQHFWSLAVEEQFYVVWPWLIVWILGAAAGRRGWSTIRSRRILGLVMAVLTAASFAFSLWETANAPTIAYFSTFSRAWELGIGALIAMAASVLARIPEILRTLMTYTGLAGIVVSLFLINPESAFPGPWALLPVAASALVVAAGTGGRQSFLAPLTNRAMRYLGDISYSLYLWHFPFAILVASVFPLEGWVLAAVLLAIFGISSASFHLLENPVRKSAWLEPAAVRRAKPRTQLKPGPYVAALGVIALLVSGSAVWHDASMRNAPSAPLPPQVAGAATPSTPETPLQSQQNKISLALTADAWPDLKPSVDQIGPDIKAPEWVQDGCLALDRAKETDPIRNAQHCTYGDPKASKTAVVIGDSMAISYVAGIRDALEPAGYKVVVYTMQECPAASVDVVRGDGSAHPQCGAFRDWAMSQVEATRPDLVFVSSARSSARRLASGAPEGAAANAEWAAGSKATFQRLVVAARKVIALDPPPGGKNLQECATKVSKPSNCTTAVDSQYKDVANATRTGAGNLGVVFPDVRSWFCKGDSCPAFAGTTPVYADTGHITAAYSKSLAPLFSELKS